MEITKARLKRLIKEEVESMKEKYNPVPQDKFDEPSAALTHIDNELSSMDADLDELMRSIDQIADRNDDRFSIVKQALRSLAGHVQKNREDYKKISSQMVAVQNAAQEVEYEKMRYEEQDEKE